MGYEVIRDNGPITIENLNGIRKQFRYREVRSNLSAVAGIFRGYTNPNLTIPAATLACPQEALLNTEDFQAEEGSEEDTVFTLFTNLFPAQDKPPRKHAADSGNLLKFVSNLWNKTKDFWKDFDKKEDLDGEFGNSMEPKTDGLPSERFFALLCGMLPCSLSRVQAHELLLFCTVCAVVHHIPDKDDVIFLKRDCMKLDDGIIQVPEKSEDPTIELLNPESTLPGFRKKQETRTLKLFQTEIRNSTDDVALVKLQNSPLQRWLQPEESLLALDTGDGFVTFQPRICVSGDTVIRQKDSRLVSDENEQDCLELKDAQPVFFAESRKYGLLIADKTGLFQDTNFRIKVPGQTVCWFRGDCEDYGFLLPDGSYRGASSRKGWTDLLFFDLGMGSGVAVTADRQAIDGSGRQLCGQVAAVSCCGSRVIFLKTDGSVETDRGAVKGLTGPVRTVCADKLGYWAATDEKLYRLNGQGQEEACYDVILDEIQRNNTGTAVFGLQKDGQLIRLL